MQSQAHIRSAPSAQRDLLHDPGYVPMKMSRRMDEMSEGVDDGT